jgi:hypothetical protein
LGFFFLFSIPVSQFNFYFASEIFIKMDRNKVFELVVGEALRVPSNLEVTDQIGDGFTVARHENKELRILLGEVVSYEKKKGVFIFIFKLSHFKKLIYKIT